MSTEPTNQQLIASLNNCCFSAAFNEDNYCNPSSDCFAKLVNLRRDRVTFLGIEDFILRGEVDRYIKEHTK
jgi:hypothetical protein